MPLVVQDSDLSIWSNCNNFWEQHFSFQFSPENVTFWCFFKNMHFSFCHCKQRFTIWSGQWKHIDGILHKRFAHADSLESKVRAFFVPRNSRARKVQKKSAESKISHNGLSQIKTTCKKWKNGGNFGFWRYKNGCNFRFRWVLACKLCVHPPFVVLSPITPNGEAPRAVWKRKMHVSKKSPKVVAFRGKLKSQKLL